MCHHRTTVHSKAFSVCHHVNSYHWNQLLSILVITIIIIVIIIIIIIIDQYTHSVSLPLSTINSIKHHPQTVLEESGIRIPDGVLLLGKNFSSLKVCLDLLMMKISLSLSLSVIVSFPTPSLFSSDSLPLFFLLLSLSSLSLSLSQLHFHSNNTYDALKFKEFLENIINEPKVTVLYMSHMFSIYFFSNFSTFLPSSTDWPLSCLISTSLIQGSCQTSFILIVSRTQWAICVTVHVQVCMYLQCACMYLQSLPVWVHI